MRWGFIGSLEYEALRSPMSSQGVVLLWGFLDMSRPWVSVGGMYKRSSVVGLSTSNGQFGRALLTPKDKTEI